MQQCYGTRVASTEEAQAFVKAMNAEFPDATHNCWAYVVGAPGSTNVVGMSDDGEPHGTAGRPMLTVLLHGGVGVMADDAMAAVYANLSLRVLLAGSGWIIGP